MGLRRITCDTAIQAGALQAWLEEAGINSVIYDESNSKVARGLLFDTSTDVMVNEEDLERAQALYEQLRKAE